MKIFHQTTPPSESERAISYQSVDKPGADEEQNPAFRRRQMIGGAIGAVLLLLIIVAAAVYTAMFYVSEDDYRRAATITDEIRAQQESLEPKRELLANAAQSGVIADAEFDRAFDTYKQALTRYKAKSEELAPLRVYRDEDAKRLLNNFTIKNQEYLEFETSISDSTPAIRAVAKRCDRTTFAAIVGEGSTVGEYTDKMDACVEAVNALASAPNQDIAKAGRTAKQYFATIRNAVADIQASEAVGDNSAYAAANDRLNEAKRAPGVFEAIAQVDYNGDSYRPTDQLNKLQNYLKSKVE